MEDINSLQRWLETVRYNEVIEHLSGDEYTYELRYDGARTGAVIVHRIIHEHLRQIGILLK